MPITTRLTELLGVQHPILLAPMDLVSDGRLAAAVSLAGGFGIIGGGYGDEAWLTRELDAAGDARVGVGFITWSMARRPRLLDLVLDRAVPAVFLSFGDVQPHADRIKASGALLLCQVQTLEQARQALKHGADVLVAQGAEAGGHGISRGTFPLVPAVVDIAGDVPVAAAGGIADGRGLAAALMLGADGVLMGTRFYAAQEAAGFDAAKDRIVAATGDAQRAVRHRAPQRMARTVLRAPAAEWLYRTLAWARTGAAAAAGRRGSPLRCRSFSGRLRHGWGDRRRGGGPDQRHPAGGGDCGASYARGGGTAGPRDESLSHYATGVIPGS